MSLLEVADSLVYVDKDARCASQPSCFLRICVHIYCCRIAWFGFNNGQTMVDGLWAGYQNATLGDFPTVLKRIKLLGFNGIQLPFTFVDLDRAPNSNIYVTGCKVRSAWLVGYAPGFIST